MPGVPRQWFYMPILFLISPGHESCLEIEERRFS